MATNLILTTKQDNKTPGPVGFTAGFFKKTWNTIGNDFVDAILEFFNNNAILKQLNHAVIALIPKSSHADSVGDFRPISCCNVTYKVISKILATRFSAHLLDIVDKAQTGFVDGRSMLDNIFLCQELIRHYGIKRGTPRCMMKIDIRKAFDSVSWSFIEDVLRGFGFPNRFVNWIMLCVTSASYSLSINGDLVGFFKGKRVLRQRDPLSPFLFVFGMEYLSRMLGILAENEDFNFHSGCKNLKINHLAFADDLMLFARRDPISVTLIMDCLKSFGLCSCLHAYLMKSEMFCAGLNEVSKAELLHIAGLKEGSLPIRYLGIPLCAVRLNVTHYDPLFCALRNYFCSWKGSSLYYAGRLQLISAVIEGVYCFWMGVFPILGSVKLKMDQMCRRFLWGGSCDKFRNSLVGWQKVCVPKKEGGLGLFQLDAWNLALLCRVVWNFHCKKDTLWVKWINEVYLEGSNFWCYCTKKRDSALLKALIGIRDKLVAATGSPAAVVNLMTSVIINLWRNGKNKLTIEVSKSLRYTIESCKHFPTKVICPV